MPRVISTRSPLGSKSRTAILPQFPPETGLLWRLRSPSSGHRLLPAHHTHPIYCGIVSITTLRTRIVENANESMRLLHSLSSVPLKRPSMIFRVFTAQTANPYSSKAAAIIATSGPNSSCRAILESTATLRYYVYQRYEPLLDRGSFDARGFRGGFDEQ